MNLNLSNSIDSKLILFWKYFSQKPNVTNCYLTDFSGLDFFEFDNCLIMTRQKGGFADLYFVAKNFDFLKLALIRLVGSFAINIPEKTNSCSADHFLTEFGASKYACYERWRNDIRNSNVNFKIESSVDSSVRIANSTHLPQLENLIGQNFDAVSEHLPSNGELMAMLSNKQIFVNVRNNEITGFFIYRIRNAECYFNFWYDSNNNGMALLNEVLSMMQENNISHYYLWVNSKNSRIKKLHKLMGAQPDGMCNHIYTLNLPL